MGSSNIFLTQPGAGYGPCYSSSSATIGVGSHTFTIGDGFAYSAGAQVTAYNSTGASMSGTVTSYSGTTLVINVPPGATIGSGTFSSWTINISSSPLGTFLDLGGAVFNVKAYGATGNGTTTDTIAMQGAINACVSVGGGTVLVPFGTFIIDAYLDINGPNVCLVGTGPGSVILAKANAGLATMISVNNAGVGFRMSNIVIDGNRANAGTVAGNSWNVNLSASNTVLDNCEVRNGNLFGIFIGDNAVVPTNVIISKCYIHHNGAATNPGAQPANGGGIYSGGTNVPTQVQVLSCYFLANYNTYGSLGECAAIVFFSSKITIRNCDFVDNLNNSGGQIGSQQTTAQTGWVVSGNRFYFTINYAGISQMHGIELLNLQDSVISDNVIEVGAAVTFPVGGIIVESSSAVTSKNVNVVNNVINGASPGLWAYANSGGTVSYITYIGNKITNAAVGIDVQNSGTVSGLTIVGNDLYNCTTKISAPNGLAGFLIKNNLGWNLSAGDATIVTVTNTVTNTLLKSFTIPALYFLSPGMGLKFRIWGQIIAAGGASDYVTFAIADNGVSTLKQVISPASTVLNNTWWAELDIKCNTVGTSGVMVYTDQEFMPLQTANTNANNGSYTYNVANAHQIQFYVQWANASAGDSFSVLGFDVTEVP